MNKHVSPADVSAFRCSTDEPVSPVRRLYMVCMTYICSLSGMKTYLISGRRLEHGCSEFVSRNPHPQPHTPDLISRGVQAAQVLLSQAEPERVGVRQIKMELFSFVKTFWGTYNFHMNELGFFFLSRHVSSV